MGHVETAEGFLEDVARRRACTTIIVRLFGCSVGRADGHRRDRGHVVDVADPHREHRSCWAQRVVLVGPFLHTAAQLPLHGRRGLAAPSQAADGGLSDMAGRARVITLA